jgi:hypothetical protein
VRSSYHAKEQAREVEAGAPGRIREVMEADLLAGPPNLIQIDAERPSRRAAGA